MHGTSQGQGIAERSNAHYEYEEAFNQLFDLVSKYLLQQVAPLSNAEYKERVEEKGIRYCLNHFRNVILLFSKLAGEFGGAASGHYFNSNSNNNNNNNDDNNIVKEHSIGVGNFGKLKKVNEVYIKTLKRFITFAQNQSLDTKIQFSPLFAVVMENVYQLSARSDNSSDELASEIFEDVLGHVVDYKDWEFDLYFYYREGILGQRGLQQHENFEEEDADQEQDCFDVNEEDECVEEDSVAFTQRGNKQTSRRNGGEQGKTLDGSLYDDLIRFYYFASLNLLLHSRFEQSYISFLKLIKILAINSKFKVNFVNSGHDDYSDIAFVDEDKRSELDLANMGRARYHQRQQLHDRNRGLDEHQLLMRQLNRGSASSGLPSSLIGDHGYGYGHGAEYAAAADDFDDDDDTDRVTADNHGRQVQASPKIKSDFFDNRDGGISSTDSNFEEGGGGGGGGKRKSKYRSNANPFGSSYGRLSGRSSIIGLGAGGGGSGSGNSSGTGRRNAADNGISKLLNKQNVFIYDTQLLNFFLLNSYLLADDWNKLEKNYHVAKFQEGVKSENNDEAHNSDNEDTNDTKDKKNITSNKTGDGRRNRHGETKLVNEDLFTRYLRSFMARAPKSQGKSADNIGSSEQDLLTAVLDKIYHRNLSEFLKVLLEGSYKNNKLAEILRDQLSKKFIVNFISSKLNGSVSCIKVQQAVKLLERPESSISEVFRASFVDCEDYNNNYSPDNNSGELLVWRVLQSGQQQPKRHRAAKESTTTSKSEAVIEIITKFGSWTVDCEKGVIYFNTTSAEKKQVIKSQKSILLNEVVNYSLSISDVNEELEYWTARMDCEVFSA